MKIHVWAPSFVANPGGIQTFTRFVVQALGDLYPDAEITVFGKNDRSHDLVESEVAFSSTRVACAPRIMGFGQWPAALRSAAFALSAVRRAGMDQPEFIISTHVNFAPVAPFAKKFARPHFAAVGHGIEVWNIRKASVQRALRAADQLLAVSDFTRTRMAEALKVDPETIALLPNTFDANRFKPGPKSPELLQRYDLTHDGPVILTVARLEATEQYKGYDNVLLAMPEIIGRFPKARYVIVGDGPDRARIEALIRRLHLSGAVIMAGYVPNDSLRDHYNLCDLFAMPSKGEGFGIVFLEALACGKPVIAGDKDASGEALLGGKLGTLVDPDDETAIGQAICSVLARLEGQKPEITQQEGEERRRAVIAAFGYERFRDRIAQLVGKIFPGRDNAVASERR